MRTYKTWAILALSVVCALSLAANAALYRMSVEQMVQANGVRLDPLGLRYYAGRQPDQPAAGQRRVVFFGDSRAEMWTTPKGQGAERFQFINRGISYQTTEQMLGRFDQDVAPLKPDVVVFQFGVNDLKCIPLFPGTKQQIVERSKSNIRELVDRGKRLGAMVVLVEVFPLGPIPLHRRPLWSDDVGTSIGTVNEFLRSLASDRVRIVEATSILADRSGTVRRDYALDMLHLTRKAYEALNQQRLLPLLQQLQ